jgi:hypothetical protein
MRLMKSKISVPGQVIFFVLLLLLPLNAEAADPWERNCYFGDLHVHTELSADAYGEGARTTIDEAYEFARGAQIRIPPYCDPGDPGCDQVTQQLERPLDFVAITDHAEFFGEQDLCRDETSEAYDTETCVDFRLNSAESFTYVWNIRLSNIPAYLSCGCGPKTIDRLSFCGENGETCLDRAGTVWRDTVVAKANTYNDPGNFTAFAGYEWSGVPNLKNWHRNVIFRNGNVPDRPASYFDVPQTGWLWSRLEAECVPPACDVLSIPHNANISDGLMFSLTNVDQTAEEYAALSAKYETLIEVVQHKGDSECLYGSGPLHSTDEECGFEKVPYGNITGARLRIPFLYVPPNPKSFVRYGLKQGLLYMVDPEDYLLEDSSFYDSQYLGINPFKYGMIGSTDTHLGTGGAVAENNYKGHLSMVGEVSEDTRLPDWEGHNPGALAVLWAEENTRDALFDAMKRRETYSTSGPRITLRFFAMWADSGSPLLDMCTDPDFVQTGYTNGVPMGGDLYTGPAGTVPTFAVYAHKDVGVPGNPDVLSTPMQKVQIIKGWVNAEGPQEIVYTINPPSKPPDTGASVDTETCAASGAGYDDLCRVWQDPDFDPGQHAFYYVRVLENPTCRWNAWFCKDIVDPCSQAGYEACCDPQFPRTIQEHALSSPIWYTP